MQLQTKFGTEGNCLQACISTLYGLDIDAIPWYEDHEHDWVQKLSTFCRAALNKNLSVVKFDCISDAVTVFADSCFIVLIDSSHPDVDRHAVICSEDRVVFDPMDGFVDGKLTEELNPSYLVFSDCIHLNDLKKV